MHRRNFYDVSPAGHGERTDSRQEVSEERGGNSVPTLSSSQSALEVSFAFFCVPSCFDTHSNVPFCCKISSSV